MLASCLECYYTHKANDKQQAQHCEPEEGNNLRLQCAHRAGARGVRAVDVNLFIPCLIRPHNIKALNISTSLDHIFF